MPSMNGTLLTAHSVVRDMDGQLFDTPLADERVQDTIRFVPHLGDEQLFLSMKALGINIDCPQTSKTGRHV
jgi:hypothetical protein